MSVSKLFPTTRYFYYHPFGNTPSENYLQSITDDVKIPKVLILGCGDIRSCFYTLWNNFDPHHSRTFKDVHFTVNDSSAAVMARSVLFIYLFVYSNAWWSRSCYNVDSFFHPFGFVMNSFQSLTDILCVLILDAFNALA